MNYKITRTNTGGGGWTLDTGDNTEYRNTREKRGHRRNLSLSKHELKRRRAKINNLRPKSLQAKETRTRPPRLRACTLHYCHNNSKNHFVIYVFINCTMFVILVSVYMSWYALCIVNHFCIIAI